MNGALWTVIIPALGATLVAIVTGLLTIMAGRKKASADIQTVINTGFSALVDNLREQIDFQTKRIDDLEAMISRYEFRVHVCEQRVRQLVNFIYDASLEPPPPLETPAARPPPEP